MELRIEAVATDRHSTIPCSPAQAACVRGVPWNGSFARVADEVSYAQQLVQL